MKVLPVTAIFGGNASGKSNFVSALMFSQAVITTSVTNGFRAVPFRLNASNLKKPSAFSFELQLMSLYTTTALNFSPTRFFVRNSPFKTALEPDSFSHATRTSSDSVPVPHYEKRIWIACRRLNNLSMTMFYFCRLLLSLRPFLPYSPYRGGFSKGSAF